MEKHLDILIIEDDPVEALRMTQELHRQGLAFRTRRVQRRQEFLGILQGPRPDLILADHRLCDLDGFAALDLVAQCWPGIPFIFVSGSCDQGLIVEMFDSGAAGHVYKQRLDDLVPVIRQVLSTHPVFPGTPREESFQGTPSREGLPSAPPSATVARNEVLMLCARCRQVQNENGRWELLESYLLRHEQATVTLAICPLCCASRLA